MDAVALDCAGNVDQVFVNHGHEGRVVLGGEVAEDLLELLDVLRAVVGGEGDGGEQDFDVRVFERGQDLVEVAAGLAGGQAAETVVAAELDDDDFRVQEQDGAEIGDGVLGGGATGALVRDLVVVAAGVEFLLQEVGIGLAGLEAVAGGDAVAKADQEGPAGSPRLRSQGRAGEKNQPQRNDKPAANVHRNSVAVRRHGTGWRFMVSHPCDREKSQGWGTGLLWVGK